MEKQIYFRDTHYVTKDERDEIINIFGHKDATIPTPYIYFSELDIYHDSGSSLKSVNDILLTIWNDSVLNTKYDELVERCKLGFTPSKSPYRKYVECNILHKLITETIEKYKGLLNEYRYNLPYIILEIKRLMKFPDETFKHHIFKSIEKYNSLSKDYHLDKYKLVQNENIDFLVKRSLNLKKQYFSTDIYREYSFELKNPPRSYYIGNISKELHKKFNFFYNINIGLYSNNYITITVGEKNINDHKAIKIVLNELIKDEMIVFSNSF